MAQWKCFYNLTNLFFSIYPIDYEKNLKEELWGCFKYIGIPMDTLMNMPIQDRRYYIQKHNEDQEGHKKGAEHAKNEHTIQGEALNTYAAMEQKKKNGK